MKQASPLTRPVRPSYVSDQHAALSALVDHARFARQRFPDPGRYRAAPIGIILDKLLKPLKGRLTSDSVADAVRSLVGPDLAARLAIDTVRRGRLLIRAAHPIYIMEARHRLTPVPPTLAALGIKEIRFQ